MPRARISKSSFNYDNNGRAILGSAKEMAAWVRLGFEEQNKRRIPEEPFQQNIIDLSNCVLFVSYPIGSKNPSSQIFNLCDLAGVVPGIEKIEDDPNYFFEVKLGIRFDGSVLYGNLFHYIKYVQTLLQTNIEFQHLTGSPALHRLVLGNCYHLATFRQQGGRGFLLSGTPR